MVERVTVQPGYLPPLSAAAWAGVSERTMKRWTKKGLPIYLDYRRMIELLDEWNRRSG